MRKSRELGRRAAAGWLLLLGLLLVVGFVGVFPPTAQAVGEPILIDDFGGNARGRTVTPQPEPGQSTTPTASFTESAGRGTLVATGNGNGRGGVRLDYDFPALDLTSGVSNTQFFLEFTSIQRVPVQQQGETAVQVSISVTDATGATGTYGTAVANIGAFNIVLNFDCVGGATTCFTPAVDFTQATHIQVLLLYPTNNDTVGTLTTVLDRIRTTPTGGVQPPPPTPSITPPAGNPIYGLSGTVLEFQIVFRSNGQVVPVSRTPVSNDGLSVDDIELNGTAPGLGSSTVTGGPGSYVLRAGPLTGSGTVSVRIPAGAVVDGWGQQNLTSSTVSVTFEIGVPPDFTNAAPPAGRVGSSYNFAFTAGGNPASTYAVVSGALPPGLSLTGNGQLSGIPTTPGSYAFAVRAVNVMGEDSFSVTALTIAQSPTITSVNSVTFVRGQAGSFTITTSGYPAPDITVQGNLPAGLDLDDNADGTATLAGTPTGPAGSRVVTVTATNAAGNATQQLTVLVQADATFTSPAETTFTVGAAGTFQVTTEAEPAAAISVPAGSLPDGLTLQDNDDGTATITGTPTGPGGLTSVTLSATNEVGSTQQTLAIIVNETPAITSDDVATFEIGAVGTTFQLTATGYPTPTFTIDGDLPDGLSLDENSGLISGTPTGSGGQTDVTVTATNVAGDSTEQTLTITVNEDPDINSPAEVTFTVGRPGTFTITTTGYPDATITSGTLPDGLTLAGTGDGTATITGTPTAATDGTTVEITASNAAGVDTQDLLIVINTAPVFTSPAVATFDRGQPGTFTVTATGLPLPQIDTDDALPPGLTLSDNNNGTATLTGTPTIAGATTITVDATNAAAASQQRLEIRVTDVPTFDSPDSTTFRELIPGEFSITTTGFPPATVTLTGPLPDGVGFTDNRDGTATVSGTPAAGSAGSYPVTVTASNQSAAGDRAGGTDDQVAALAVGTVSQQLTITVTAAPSATATPTASPTSTTPVADPTDTDDPGSDDPDFDDAGDSDPDISSTTDDLADTGGPSPLIGLLGLAFIAAGAGFWLASRRTTRHS